MPELTRTAKNQAMFDVQKQEQSNKISARVIAKQVEPFFSGMLVLGSAFMSILLFGTGSYLGGIVFLLPVAIAVFVYWNDGKSHQEVSAPDTPENEPRDRFGA
jgi:hypothetical protein